MCEVDVGLGVKTREVSHSVQILGNFWHCGHHGHHHYDNGHHCNFHHYTSPKSSLVAPVITNWDEKLEAIAGDDVVIR